MQETLIDQGLDLMLFGMGTVFVFLTILVFATTLMSKLVGKFAGTDSPVAAPSESTESTASLPASPTIIKAIEKAIAQHRRR